MDMAGKMGWKKVPWSSCSFVSIGGWFLGGFLVLHVLAIHFFGINYDTCILHCLFRETCASFRTIQCWYR